MGPDGAQAEPAEPIGIHRNQNSTEGAKGAERGPGAQGVPEEARGSQREPGEPEQPKGPRGNQREPEGTKACMSQRYDKPCISQYKLLRGETANGSKQASLIWWSFMAWRTVVNLEQIHAPRPNFLDGSVYELQNQLGPCLVFWRFMITERIA